MVCRARVLADSRSPSGVRLTTLEVTFPRFVLAEFNTHRMFSRNSASSRAIPTQKLIERVLDDPAMPIEWGANRPGMSAGEEVDPASRERARATWLAARDAAVEYAQRLATLGLHKQIVNRVLEPFLWQTVIVTATEWENFFTLRCAPNAQPELRAAAIAMRDALRASTPREVGYGEWHLPLILDDERGLDPELLRTVSAARCARVSYLTHDGRRDLDKDVELYHRLVCDGHLSPLEHVATPARDDAFHANLRGWIHLRSTAERTPSKHAASVGD